MPAVPLLLAAPPKVALPACNPSPPAGLDSPYVCAGAVFEVLGRVKKGIDRVPTTGPMDATAVVKAFRTARDDFACAARCPAPYLESGSDLIRKAAEVQVAVTDERMEEAIKRKDMAMGDFVTMTSFFATVLIEFQDEKPTGRILVTRAERQSLKSRLEKAFGKAIRGGPREGDDPVTTVAARWYRVLADPEVRSLDGA
jgi:hypothetical protein